MNRYNLSEEGSIGYEQVAAHRTWMLHEDEIYDCCIVFAQATKAGKELEIIWELHSKKTRLEFNVLNKYVIGSPEYYVLIENIYSKAGDIIEVNLNDFDEFYGSCNIEFVNGYPKVHIIDSVQKITSKLTKELYNI